MSRGRVDKAADRRIEAERARKRSKAARDAESRSLGSRKGSVRGGEAHRAPSPITLPKPPWEDRECPGE